MEVVELAGTVVFATSGVFAVVTRGLDWFGLIVVGTVTALGGGTIRDLVLGNAPVFWINELGFLAAGTVGALAAIPLAHRLAQGPARRFEESLQLADAAGLALFAVVGANTALALGFDGWIAVVSGVVTGIGGGMIRDVLSSRIPLVLSGEIYALAAIAGSAVFVALVELTSLNTPLAATLGALTVFIARVAGIQRGWSLPSLGDRPEP